VFQGDTSSTKASINTCAQRGPVHGLTHLSNRAGHLCAVAGCGRRQAEPSPYQIRRCGATTRPWRNNEFIDRPDQARLNSLLDNTLLLWCQIDAHETPQPLLSRVSYPYRVLSGPLLCALSLFPPLRYSLITEALSNQSWLRNCADTPLPPFVV